MFQRPTQREGAVSQAEVSDARFKRFMRDLREYETAQAYEEALNAFLDLYSAWLKMHEPWLKIRLVMLAFELNRLNPAFECSLSFAE